MPYPLPKLDLIALPGGFGGAMENWGGITYYESVLLFDPKNSATSTKQDVFAVIAHEMAHQWFGDLVTMAWWDNLWLNEGFASWMGSKCTDHFNPDWAEWLRRSVPRSATGRVGSPKDSAMQSDARSTTHPVQREIKTEARGEQRFRRHHLSQRASRLFACWRVFSARMFSATAFGNTSRSTNIRTPRPPISGMR